MTALNAYATLAEYKAFTVARGQTATTDAGDDATIEKLLEAASRYLDAASGRRFFPYIQTRYYDVPVGRELILDDDLLEVISLLDGSSAAIPATEYNLIPRNETPAWAITLKQLSTYSWLGGASSGGTELAIAITAIWGCRQRYTEDGFRAASTLSEDLDIAEVQFDVASETAYSVSQIVRYGNELGVIASIVTGKITVAQRGDNGSTAAVHTSGDSLRIWAPMEDLRNATLEITMTAYKRRFGKSESNVQTITGMGVVLTPRDIPTMATEFITTLRKRI